MVGVVTTFCYSENTYARSNSTKGICEIPANPCCPEQPETEIGYECFSDANDLHSYLTSKYESFNNGSVFVSGQYLEKCKDDPLELVGLEEMLRYADRMIKSKKEGKGPQMFKMFIDGDGKVTTMSMRVTVTLNAFRRSAQISIAKTSGDMGRVMAAIKGDLRQVQAGQKMGACDRATVAKAKALANAAAQKMKKLKNKEKEKELKGEKIKKYGVCILI